MKSLIIGGVAALSATSMAWAQAVHLSCSGTINWSTPNRSETEDIGPISTTIDTEKGTVSFGAHKPWRIIKGDSRNTVSFEGGYLDETGFSGGTAGWVYMGGLIDRVTGQAHVWSRRTNAEGPVLATMDLNCKPARPVF
jgi:hypothetical protein